MFLLAQLTLSNCAKTKSVTILLLIMRRRGEIPTCQRDSVGGGDTIVVHASKQGELRAVGHRGVAAQAGVHGGAAIGGQGLRVGVEVVASDAPRAQVPVQAASPLASVFGLALGCPHCSGPAGGRKSTRLKANRNAGKPKLDPKVKDKHWIHCARGKKMCSVVAKIPPLSAEAPRSRKPQT